MRRQHREARAAPVQRLAPLPGTERGGEPTADEQQSDDDDEWAYAFPSPGTDENPGGQKNRSGSSLVNRTRESSESGRAWIGNSPRSRAWFSSRPAAPAER